MNGKTEGAISSGLRFFGVIGKKTRRARCCSLYPLRTYKQVLKQKNDAKKGDLLLSLEKKQTILSSQGIKVPLTDQEQKVFEIIRGLDYGEVRITVKKGIPVLVDEIQRSIKL